MRRPAGCSRASPSLPAGSGSTRPRRWAGRPGELGVEVIEGLTTLADHSLVQPMAGPDLPRFRLLETIRKFAADRLAESDERATIHRRHADAYLALAEEAAQHMPGGDQVPWLDRLAVDHDNLRGAMSWAIETGRGGDRPSAARRPCGGSGNSAATSPRGASEPQQVLAMPGADAPTLWRMRALEAAGGTRVVGRRRARRRTSCTNRRSTSPASLATSRGSPTGCSTSPIRDSASPAIPGSWPALADRGRRRCTGRSATNDSSRASAGQRGIGALMAQGRFAEAEEIARRVTAQVRGVGRRVLRRVGVNDARRGGVRQGDLDGRWTWACADCCPTTRWATSPR